MTVSISTRDFTRGALSATPFLLLAGPFAMLYGVVAAEAGLSLPQIMGFSVFMVAGAAQFAALQQMVLGTPVIVVLAAALAVNLRMAMYSAALVPHLGRAPLWQRLIMAYCLFDQSYAYAILEFDRRPGMDLGQRVGFFLGAAFPVSLGWYGGTWAGAVLGTRLPDEVPLDFALPILFLAMVAPMLKTRTHWVAASVSVGAGLLLTGLPWGTGLLVAACLAMLAGALWEGAK